MCRFRARGASPKLFAVLTMISLFCEVFVHSVGWLRRAEAGWNVFLQIRTWDCWGIRGYDWVSYFATTRNLLHYYQSETLMNIACTSPICMWYRSKHQKFLHLAMFGYAAGGMMLGVTLMMLRAFLWTMSFSPRELRYSFVTTFVAMHLLVIVHVVFDMGMEHVYVDLNEQHHYPNPPYGLGTYMLWGWMGLTFLRLLVSGFLFAKSREFEHDETSSDDSSDDADEVRRAKDNFKGMKGMRVAPDKGVGKMNVMRKGKK
ncbi:unnamed protein product [Amoebophrya sp. A25]|nr:unnamed protein product [Amoebophrya sp. A25]|eukprot:GSA25T00020543001.1